MGRLAPLLAVVLWVLTGCGPRMVDQQKDLPYGASALFPDGKVNQRPPAGTVARDALEQARALEQRPPMTAALLDRGQDRFQVFCVPCHGIDGRGDGIIPQHGFPRPPSFHQDRLRQAPAHHYVDVITNGHGVMYSYAARVPAADRWAIAAYIRALQTSQQVSAASLPEDLRNRLEAQTEAPQ